ncbi:hypothetical protein [Dietzia aerolata]|nr:hypothetical protein [Dietzia aerolata]
MNSATNIPARISSAITTDTTRTITVRCFASSEVLPLTSAARASEGLLHP